MKPGVTYNYHPVMKDYIWETWLITMGSKIDHKFEELEEVMQSEKGADMV